jgi:MarR family transcriptional regulator, 2-MHQ and catechol-resistance regulon repressor
MPTHFHGSEESVRALNAYINLVRASDSVLRRMSGQLESERLTLGQFGILEALFHLGPMCQKTLGEKLLRSGGNVTLVVDNLEKHGWVRRERQQDDRRMVLIHLTQEGRSLISRVVPRHVEAVVQVLSRLEHSEQESLRHICRKLGKGTNEFRGARQGKEKSDNDTNSTK